MNKRDNRWGLKKTINDDERTTKMAYTGYIYDVIDAATMYVRVQVTPQNTDTSLAPLPPTLHKYITSHPHPGMNAYLTDISPNDFQEHRHFKYDFNNETRKGKPVLIVKKVALNGPDGSSWPDTWGVDQVPDLIGDLLTYPPTRSRDWETKKRDVQQICWLQYLMIKDLQEKVKALTPTTTATADLLHFSETPTDEFETEVQHRLAKELYEQRINAEVKRRLSAMSNPFE